MGESSPVETKFSLPIPTCTPLRVRSLSPGSWFFARIPLNPFAGSGNMANSASRDSVVDRIVRLISAFPEGALTGTVRATALFLTPFVMALLVSVAPVAAALVTAGVFITLPAARGNRRKDLPQQAEPTESGPCRPHQQDHLEAPPKEVPDDN